MLTASVIKRGFNPQSRQGKIHGYLWGARRDRNETKRNEINENETKRNETKRNQQKRNETKRKSTNWKAK